MRIDTVVKAVSCLSFAYLWFSPVYGQSKRLSDTLTSTYVTAVSSWLHGRDEQAKKQLLAVPAHHDSTEQRSAWHLLLDEFYFWPGEYQRYLQLADSLQVAANFYGSAKLLAQQPAVQYQLRTDSIVIPIRLKHKSHPVVDVLLNGHICRLILDTGAQRTMLSRRFVNRLGAAKLTTLTVTNYNGENVQGSLLMADSLVLGSLTVKNLPVIGAQMPFLGVDGLLGWDVLRQFAITIDYVNRQFTLRRSMPKANGNPNLLGGSYPMVLAYGAVNNQLNVVLDTGDNRQFSVSPTGLTKIGPYRTKQRLAFSSAVGQPVHISRDRLVKRTAISIDGVSYPFRNSAVFRADNVVGQVIRDGVLGSGAFRRGILRLDAPNHRFTYQHKSKQDQ
ncbi:retropepsin-like aspartic protease [Spirosoma agri]|uniref:Clan AA aspartic protease n=1 Tax=Spirosoma agri TaxID=1987381 RepID=A0A6M0IDB4_9BACT|nr:retropepsin-like aspartic protease [Spirosoma agri]NEU66214.1 clan AA aspartic protease [Spirosoma agri]